MGRLCPEHAREWQAWLDYRVTPRPRFAAAAAYDFTERGVVENRRALADGWAETIRFQQGLIVKACTEQRRRTPVREGSLFTGYNGAGMAATAVLGTEPAWFVENDVAASRLLDHHYPGVKNLGDITLIDWHQVDPVDVLTAGFPCQDISSAGRRAGIEGERSGLWRFAADAIRVLRPGIVLLENVGDLVVRGLDRVAGDLAEVGYDLRWTCLRASDVGACHQRNRWFGIAVPHAGEPIAGFADETAADPPGPRWTEDLAGHSVRADGAQQMALGQAQPGGRDRVAADTHGGGRSGRSHSEQQGRAAVGRDSASTVGWGQYGPAIERWGRVLGRPAPEPTIPGRRGGRKLNPALTEWMMGLPEGQVTGVPGLSVDEMLEMCGNGVVPQQAAAAWAMLLSDLWRCAA